MQHQLFTNEIVQNFAEYIDLLSNNDDDRYIVCIPSDTIIQENCEIDTKFIQEHILELLVNNQNQSSPDVPEYRSLSGNCYKKVEHELHLISSNQKGQNGRPAVFATLLSTDQFFLQSGQFIRRFLLSNTLDQRFFKEIKNNLLDDNDSGDRANAQGKPQEKGGLKIMRDPNEFINFFKTNVYFEVDDLYHDFLEDIKMLRENHIMIKGHEKTSGRNFIKIGQKFKQQLEQLQIINLAFQQYPDQLKKETIENLTETLVYERIGTFLRRNLVTQYMQEETKLIQKCNDLLFLFNSDIMTFNQVFGSNLLPNMKPTKSIKIFKLFISKCQLPYEMVFVLGKTMKLCIQELAEYYNKEVNQIDADTMIPYMVYVVIKSIVEANSEYLEQNNPDNENDSQQFNEEHLLYTCFKSRLLMVEHFTVQELGFGEAYYAFVSFKNVEKMIEDCKV